MNLAAATTNDLLNLDAALADAELRYAAERPRSREQIERASKSLPGGNSRTVLFYKPFPIVVEKSSGCRLWDLDGNEYVDFLGEYTAGLFGHSDPVIKAAIQSVLETGWAHGGHIENEANLAEILCSRFPSLDRVRFCNSGTEANLMAITTARVFTKRDKIMFFRGGYHGGILIFKTGSAPQNAPYPIVLGEYNNAEQAAALIEAHGNELSAVVVEPFQGSAGCIPGDREFLQALRDGCSRYGVVLIFDEVMSSRLAPGGLQEALGITPDMTTLGKYIGGGASFGAFGGRADIMAIYDPYRPDVLSHAGTFNNNAITMAAGVAAMSKVYTPERALEFNAQGDHFRKKLTDIVEARELPIQFTGRGSLTNIHFSRKPIRTVADADASSQNAKSLFHIAMMLHGYYCARRGMINLSLPMTQAETDGFVKTFEDFLTSYADVLVS